MSSTVASAGGIDQLLADTAQRVSAASIAEAQASVRRIQEDAPSREHLIYRMFAADPRS